MPISMTAFGVAYHRFAHLFFDGTPKILNDDIVERLLPPEAKNKVTGSKEVWFSQTAMRLRANVLVRSRFAEDEAAKAIADGATTIVILGAGLDTCSLRMSPRFPSVQFVEVDQKETQTSKIDLLKISGIKIPQNVSFLAVDFEKDNLEMILIANGISKSTQVFFSWLGVTMYLTKEAILNTLRVCSSFASGTKIVLTFANSANVKNDVEQRASDKGEIWLSKFSEQEAKELLREGGFASGTVVNPGEIQRLYFADRTDSLECPRRAFLAIGTT